MEPSVRRNKTQICIDKSLNLLWFAPLVVGIILLSTLIGRLLHVDAMVNDQIDIAVKAPTPGIMAERIGEARANLVDLGLASGDGALFSESPNKDLQRFYDDLGVFQLKAEELQATENVHSEAYQQELVNLQMNLKAAQVSRVWAELTSSWSSLYGLVFLALVIPGAMLKDALDNRLARRRTNRYWSSPNGHPA